ncbi:hypothetical protein F5Y01DRAFT_323655 [Xylaria sp. FL0043]|nr:hypothetical protein F5Y01DRAFT_323655 [Xylaria sp. FL0043]
MEVVGLIAAVPGLIELTKTTLSLLRDLSHSRKTLSEVTNGLEPELLALTEVLELIVSKRHSSCLLSNQRQKLRPVIQQLRDQLKSLNEFLLTTQSEKRLQRMKVIVSRRKNKLRDDVQKLERNVSILKLYLLECNITLNEEVLTATASAKKAELRTLLNPCGHDFICAKLDGTLDWFLSNPIAKSWLAASCPPSPTLSPASRLLLIHGSKGSGKSVLAASAANYIKSTGTPCAFYSFFHGIERQRKFKSMFSTILWQMLNFDGTSSEIFSRVHDILLSCDFVSITSLLQAIECVFPILKTPFYIFVDGIDESDDDWSSGDGPMKIFEGWLTQFPQLHILLAGRQSILHHEVARYPERSIELSEDVTRGDISLFINHKIRDYPHLDAMPEHVRSHIQRVLQEKSTGMFLWVDLVFKELRYCHSPSLVRDCLEALPRQLEDEYARLFSQLISRLHGEADRLGPPIRMARTLLALIMSALEPLTIDDLRHAYAASCGKGRLWEDELITEDAVLDLIGDFIICTGSETRHIHFCHFSLEELLLLPQEKWKGRLEQIEFFRLELLECHQIMGRASLEYVAHFDFGYPLVEDSYHKLVEKAFLVYATRNGLSHLRQWSSKGMNEMLETYITSPNFGGLLEYIAIASLENFEFLEDYISGIFNDDLLDLFPIIVARIMTESANRLEKFGSQDPRTQSWNQILNALSKIIPESQAFSHFGSRSVQSHPIDPPISSLTHAEAAQMKVRPTEVALQVLNRSSSPCRHRPAQSSSKATVKNRTIDSRTAEIINAAVQSNIKGMVSTHSFRQALQLWVSPEAAFKKLAQSFVASMPIPIHLLYAVTVQDRNLRLALFDLAMHRTEGQKTLYRAYAIMGYLESCDIDQTEEERYQSELHGINLKKDNPMTRMMMYPAVRSHIIILSSLDRASEIPRLIDDLLTRVDLFRPRATGHWRQYFVHSQVYKTDIWRSWEIELLRSIGTILFNIGLSSDAERIYAHVSACAKARYGAHAHETLHFLAHQAESLIESRKFSKCQQITKEILKDQSHYKRARYELYTIRYFAAAAAHNLGQYRYASDILHTLLQDLRPRGKKDWKHLDLEEQALVAQARVLFLEVLASDANLDQDHDTRKSILISTLEHLDQSCGRDIEQLWSNDAVWKCCIASDAVNGANHAVTWRLEDYLSYSRSRPNGIYWCTCDEGFCYHPKGLGAASCKRCGVA